ncbi:class I SAM-dependent methyltransferase [Arthrobacter sp. zg-Y826]|uniref:class I SAM-dependent methyltransferase n=1 Tax=Arthrobacter jinronghuae TaxID=2964609 RepID=UPI00210652D2|nr:class I SAM-dependent methyltransferase [Arthrobacter jinronghuae]MCQ1956594.1 class I SAM-dependent methyltransferase [Arthrobacter jinronghuae]
MTETQSGVEADRELKAKLRAVWALGNYTAVATEIISGLGPVLVQACNITDRDEVLDVAAGTGNAAIPAAETGADVTASDLTPELLESGKRLAEARGANLSWVVADAEALPFADGSFDTVISCVGVMFAPHHRQTAAELVRVCRPGGRIGLINWTPEGFIGRMFASMKPYAPPPPPGAQPPPLWGSVEHVQSLLAGRVREFWAERRTVRVDRFATPEEFLAFFKANYGPTIAVYKSIAGSPDRAAALDEELMALVRRFSAGTGGTAMDWEYLLVTAHRA